MELPRRKEANVIDTIESLARCVALGDGRDPTQTTPADRERSIDFLNLFQAATWWVRQRDPCPRCQGSGIEPRVGAAHPPAVIAKAAA